MNEEFNYQEDIHINQDRLDEEWRNQPALFLKYAEASAKAWATVDRAKEKVSLVKAQFAQYLRDNTNIKGKPPSETAITSLIPTDVEVKKAIKECNEAKEEAALLQAAKEAFEQRKSALENLVRLYGQSYFSTPHVSGEEGEKGKEKVKEQAQNRQAKKVTRARARGSRTK